MPSPVLTVVEVDGPAQMLERTAALRAADPLRTNVIASVATGVLQGRGYERELWFIVEDELGPVGAAIWTSPYRLLLAPMPDEAASALGQHLRARGELPPGIVGPAECVHPVAAAAGWQVQQRMAEHLLVLQEFVAAEGVPGSARRATAADTGLGADWMQRFSDDSGALVPDPRATFEGRLATTWLWEVDGVPVSLAAHAPLVDSPAGAVARIGPVFTPREHRGRGFAGAVTSAVVADVLPRTGAVMLFTDASNPTSNGVYERLGFRVVAGVVDVDVVGPIGSPRDITDG